MFKNAEGYPDPTCGAALANLERKAIEASKKEEDDKIRREQILRRKKVYVASPFAGDVPTNVKNARKYCRFTAKKKKIPIASHLLYPQFLRDDIPVERELGTLFGLALLALCDELWVFGKKASPGMVAEIEEAQRLKKPIRFFTEEMEEFR